MLVPQFLRHLTAVLDGGGTFTNDELRLLPKEFLLLTPPDTRKRMGGAMGTALTKKVMHHQLRLTCPQRSSQLWISVRLLHQ